MTQMDRDTYVSSRLKDGVLTLTLQAGAAHALSLGMIRALHKAIDDAAQSADVRVMVIHGPGRIFCAGHDLKEIARHRGDEDNGEAYLRHLFEACGEMMQALTLCPKPSVAVVEGIATAGGLQLVAACDLALATPEARVCLPGITNGGFCSTPAVAVARNIGRKAVMEMALTGQVMDAEWATGVGLFNRVVHPDVLWDEVEALTALIAKGTPNAVGRGKVTLYQQLEMPLDAAYARATDVMIGHFMDPERIEKEKASRFSQ